MKKGKIVWRFGGDGEGLAAGGCSGDGLRVMVSQPGAARVMDFV